MPRIERAIPALLLAFAVGGCGDSITRTDSCWGWMDSCIDYSTAVMESVVDFPAAAVERNATGGYMQGRLTVGDTLRVALIRYAAYGGSPCGVRRDTVRAVTWGVTDLAEGWHWGAGAARVIRTEKDGSVIIAAVAEGVFGISFGTHGETPQQLASKEAGRVIACGSTGWDQQVRAINVVARAG